MSAVIDKRARHHFDSLTHDEKIEAIHDLHEAGFSAHGIAHATRMSVEQIRKILAERAEVALR